MDLPHLIESTLVGMGYELVALERIGRGHLRVYIDQLTDREAGIGLVDCERVSRQLTRVFEVENVDYDRLEVSSPGLDRPLVKAADFDRFAGHKAQIRLSRPLDGRKRFSGVLVGMREDQVVLQVDATEVLIALMDIEKARLIPEL
ncbi:MAG: ribosome maturation factor RimP [Betaproteobacteria bacterium]|nr:ribosome maturation factor RimP [Betaproteobacteria bacterium]